MMRRSPKLTAWCIQCVTIKVVSLSPAITSSVSASQVRAFGIKGRSVLNRSRSGRRQVAMRSVRACRCPPERLPMASPSFGRLRPLPRSNTIFGESCAYLVVLVPAVVLDHIRYWWYVLEKNWFVVARLFADSAVLGSCNSFLMAEKEGNTNEKNAVEGPRTTKKPYQEPAFRYEKVFETMALSCGKVQPTNFQCSFHRNAS